MNKLAIYLAVITAIFGLFLLLPLGSIPWISYSVILGIHVVLGIGLAILLVRLVYTHVPTELFNPFKRGYKKWNGFKLLLYLFLAIISGVLLLFFYVRWLIYFHAFIGLWALLVSWKHTR